MSEVTGGVVTRRRPTSAPVNYEEQVEPYMRKQNAKRDKERWREIKHKNKVMQGKLRNIEHEPPAVFHAPVSYQSLRSPPRSAPPRQRVAHKAAGLSPPKARPSTMPGHPYHVDVPPWPPKRCETYTIARRRHQHDVDAGNTHMFKKLSEIYTSRRPRSVLNPGGVYQLGDKAPRASVDLATEWAQRTSFYLPTKPSRKNNPLHPDYVHASYAAPDRPADRVLAALGILPGQSPHSSTSAPYSTSDVRARRARHAGSARTRSAHTASFESLSELEDSMSTPYRPQSAQPHLQPQAATRQTGTRPQPGSQQCGVGGPSVDPPPSPQAGQTPRASFFGAGDRAAGLHEGQPERSPSPACSAAQDHEASWLDGPEGCASPEVSLEPSPPPEGWPGFKNNRSPSTGRSAPSKTPPRHPKHVSTKSIMDKSEFRGFYASKGCGHSHSVPKSLGVAQCAGCGARSYYRAGGVQLSPCVRGCKQAFYCSETCARVDWPIHEPYCKWVTNGQWMQPGCRVSQQLWVANASLAAGRAALKKSRDSAKMQPTILDEIEAEQGFEEAVRKARAKEIAADKKQKHIEFLAYHGMDGPRPCMYWGGKPI